MTQTRLDALTLYALAFGVVLAIGETIVLFTTTKYWPLSLDDYLASAALIFVALHRTNPLRLPLLAVLFAFLTGNLYAMLFTRLDPGSGTGERIGLLVVATTLAALGLAFSLHRSATPFAPARTTGQRPTQESGRTVEGRRRSSLTRFV